VLGAATFHGRVKRCDDSNECTIEPMRDRTDRVVFDNVFPGVFSLVSSTLSVGDTISFRVFQKYKRKWLPDFYSCQKLE
jgi:hypothetical protein